MTIFNNNNKINNSQKLNKMIKNNIKLILKINKYKRNNDEKIQIHKMVLTYYKKICHIPLSQLKNTINKFITNHNKVY
jgi:hypothetical protein